MKLYTFIIALAISGCTTDDNQRSYAHPITGDKMVFNITSKNGWGIQTSTNGKMLIITKNDNVIIIVGDSTDGRDINIPSANFKGGLLSLTDKNHDNIYETIRYGNGDLEVFDVNLDGVIDGLLNLKNKTMHVNYKGELVLLQGMGREKKYIIKDGKNIQMKYIDGIFVANEQQQHNNTLNKDNLFNGPKAAH